MVLCNDGATASIANTQQQQQVRRTTRIDEKADDPTSSSTGGNVAGYGERERRQSPSNAQIPLGGSFELQQQPNKKHGDVDDDSPWRRRTYRSDWDITQQNCGIVPNENSYDVRGESLSKEEFRAKYGGYFSTTDLVVGSAAAAQPNYSAAGSSAIRKDRGERRQFYYHRHPSAAAGGSNVYYYSDQQPDNEEDEQQQQQRYNYSTDDHHDSSTDVEREPLKDRRLLIPSSSTFWTDSGPKVVAKRQSTTVSACSNPVPLVTFRPLSTTVVQIGQTTNTQKEATNPFVPSLLLEEGPTGQPSLLNPRYSADYLDYYNKATTKLEQEKMRVENEMSTRKTNKMKMKSPGGAACVSFRLQTDIIGTDGGAENFEHGSREHGGNGNDDYVNDDVDDDEAIWEPKTQFEKITEINTDYNSNRSNFIHEDTPPISSSAPAVIPNPTSPTPTADVMNNADVCSCSPPPVDRSQDSVESGPPPPKREISRMPNKQNTNETSGDLAREQTYCVKVAPPSGESTRESTPIYADSDAAASALKIESSSHKFQNGGGRKSRKPNAELEEKLQRVARDLDSSRIAVVPSSMPTKPPAPVPPPRPVRPTTNGGGPSLRKCSSAYVVQLGSPSKAKSDATANLMTSSMHGALGMGNGRGDEEMLMLGGISHHHRCSSVDAAAAPIGSEPQCCRTKASKGNRQARSRFASIRKFLRMSESASCSLINNSSSSSSSMHRFSVDHHDSSSTNCSTISCSSSSTNASSSLFGGSGSGGLHSSLRKFPLFPSRKTRVSLNTVKGLFHGANECRALGEIAQDTDVIVTEITELPSANNTLIRPISSATNRGSNLGPLQIHIDSSASAMTTSASASDDDDRTASNLTINGSNHEDEITLKGSSVCINYDLDATTSAANGGGGHENQTKPPAPTSSSARRQSTAATSASASSVGGSTVTTNGSGKVKRPAPSVPSAKNNITSPNSSSLEKGQGQFWSVSAKIVAKPPTDSKAKPPSPMFSSMAASPTPSGLRRPSTTPADDRYEQLAAEQLTTLSYLVENFPSTIQQCRRKLANLGIDPSKMSWSDFTVTASAPILVTETSALYAGALKLEIYQEAQSVKVDLMITPLKYTAPFRAPMNRHLSFFPPVVAEFQDYIPSRLIKLNQQDDEEEDDEEEEFRGICEEGHRRNYAAADQSLLTQCKIVILPRMTVSSIESYADHTSARHRIHKQPYSHEQEACFIMIQFISALKYLQSKGVEEIRADLEGFLLFRTPSGKYPQLVLCCEAFSDNLPAPPIPTKLFNDTEQRRRRLPFISLCHGALVAMCQILHAEIPTEELIRDRDHDGQILPIIFPRLTSFSEGFQKAAEILRREKPHSLTQSKCLFEYMFWVVDQQQQGRNNNNETAGKCIFQTEEQARWWLDKERNRFIGNAVKSLLYFPLDGAAFAAATADNNNKQTATANRSNNSVVSKLDFLDEYHAQFLLHSTGKSLLETAALFVNNEAVECGGEIFL